MATIELEDVFLDYPVYGANADSLKSVLVKALSGGRLSKEAGAVKVHALKNINLKLKKGDRLGLIGSNGAGKTTLLKVLAQIYEPSQGRAVITGHTNSLFDITVGMDYALSGYENIWLRGLVLGLSKKEIEKTIPDIETFCELGPFLKMPLKSYSSGMLIRLAFGIITSMRSEILLIDEILNVGDANFMDKAKARITDLIHRSDIFVLSTHDPHIMKEFCTQGLWLDQGEVRFFGEISEAISIYSLQRGVGRNP